MINKTAILGNITGLGFCMGMAFITPLSYAQMQHSTEQTSQFQRIEQPLWVKAIVTAGGLGLIGLELWWFLLSKPRSQKAETKQ